MAFRFLALQKLSTVGRVNCRHIFLAQKLSVVWKRTTVRQAEVQAPNLAGQGRLLDSSGGSTQNTIAFDRIGGISFSVLTQLVSDFPLWQQSSTAGAH